jgi:Mn2+/Fe2+ NRAMP family transporter
MAIIGAGTVYGLAWLTLLLFPVIAVVQSVSTRVGVASHLDLQSAVSETQGRTARWGLLLSILAVNIVTIGADLEGGAAAIGLIFGGDWRWFVAPLSVTLLCALLFVGYHVMQRALKYLMLCLLAYAAAALLARPDWGQVARGSLVPHVEPTREYLVDAMSLIGTTLTSYVYVWQTIGQAEDRVPWRWHRARQTDAVTGSFFAVLVFWCILVATGATLGVNHVSAETAQGASEALRPAAGRFAGDLFALGLLASSVVALPVIMATTAYATGAHFSWSGGLSLKVREAPLFYGAVSASILLGAVADYAGVAPIRLLFVAGIVGAVGTPLGLVMLMRVATNRRIMRGHALSPGMRWVGWSVTALISLVSAVCLLWIVAGDLF